MGLADIWDQFFKSFMIFVGTGIIWLRFLEPLFADVSLSSRLMIITAVVLSVGKFVTGLMQIKKQNKAAQALIEATYAQHEEAG
jgi:hypothetical protein